MDPNRHAKGWWQERDENKALIHHRDDVAYYLKGWICTVKSATHVSE